MNFCPKKALLDLAKDSRYGILMWMVFVLVLLAVVCGPVDGSVSPGNSPTTSYAMLGYEFLSIQNVRRGCKLIEY